jgi:CheY-like chemotaxis protein
MGKAPLFTLIVSNSTVVLSQLRLGGFRRVDLHTQVASTCANVISLLAKQLPDAVVLEADLPDGDAFSLCARVRNELGFAELPVIVVCEGSISKGMLPRIAASGCDEVLSAPLARGQLYDVLAEYLGLPRRSELRVNVLAQVTAQGTLVQQRGKIYDLTLSGARIRLEQPFTGESPLRICIQQDDDSELVLEGAVVWHRQWARGAELAVQFANVPADAAQRLEALATWRLELQGDQQVVVLQRTLNERSSFGGLARQLESRVLFDVRHLSMINSMGVSRWISFLREIPAHVEYQFVHCSVPFCTQASFIPDMIGRGQVLSFFAPYYCSPCDREAEREIATSSLSTIGETITAPTLLCPSCNEVMLFEDLPERFFRFLRRVQTD